ncbi:hypothetical protein [Vibrio sp. RE88]|uniref:hypothetical protein n=1 Tax=Vibrio sp. RE88 TaxID=2607610 RepID=UPI001C111A64|nr:hypothetical protein [Vibrio sp. RE88]
MSTLQAIPTQHGIGILNSELKNTVTKYRLIGALTHDAPSESLYSFFENTIETSYYDDNGVLTFILNLPIEQHFDEYLHQIHVLDNNNQSVIECSTPKVALPKGIGGMVTLKAAISGEAGEVIFKHSEFVTETELTELFLPKYLPKIGGTITQPIALNYESISMAVFDIRNLKPDAYWNYINMACGVNSGGGDIGSVHLGYCTQPADGAPAHSFHMRIRGDKTQMSWNYGYVKAHVPLYDESGELVANRKQMAQLPLYPEILTDHKKFAISLSGTTLTVANNQVIRMRGWSDVNTSNLTRNFTVDLSLTYHLRFSVEKGLHLWYVGHTDYNPDGLSEVRFHL